ncbi:hypothetical protein DIPPA_04482 [Diplonema papillatum]|nr:hypothetical protein DIPPA_04482 [Diplonema papillatum]
MSTAPQLRQRKGLPVDEDTGLDELKRENERIAELIRAKQENRRLREQLEKEAADGPEPPVRPASAAAASSVPGARQDGPANLPQPEFAQMLRSVTAGGQLTPELEGALRHLQSLEAKIGQTRRSADQLPEDEAQQLLREVREWDTVSKQVMMQMLFTESGAKKKKRRGMHKILVFSFLVVFLALVAAAAVRFLFYQPKSTVTIRT